MWLITFDIDGTMEFGDPNGLLTRAHVDYFRAKGALIGSASDRPESAQKRMWREYGVEPDFYIMKHRMAALKERFPHVQAYWHVGDRPVDQQTAQAAGFTFFWPDQFPAIDVAEAFLAGAANGDGGGMTLAEAALRLAVHVTDNVQDVSAYDDPYAGSGRLPGDDLGTAFPI